MVFARLTVISLDPFLNSERTSKDEQERHTNADDGDNVHERCNQEELGLKAGCKLRLTSRTFNQFATEITKRDSGAGTTDSEDDCSSDQVSSVNSFHHFSPGIVRRLKPLMGIMCLIDIHNRQHHKEVGLQHDYQNVKDRPTEVERKLVIT